MRLFLKASAVGNGLCGGFRRIAGGMWISGAFGWQVLQVGMSAWALRLLRRAGPLRFNCNPEFSEG